MAAAFFSGGRGENRCEFKSTRVSEKELRSSVTTAREI